MLCKSVWKDYWLLVINYCLLVIDYQRVKLLVKKFSFWKFLLNKIVLFNILKNSFNTYLNWVFSWIFTLILNLDWTTLWFLKLAWLLILDLSLWHHQNNLGKHCFHNPSSIFFLALSLKSGALSGWLAKPTDWLSEKLKISTSQTCLINLKLKGNDY